MWMGRVCRYLQFSGIAIAVAHEITHGFDDEGYLRMCIKFLSELEPGHEVIGSIIGQVGHVSVSLTQINRELTAGVLRLFKIYVLIFLHFL